MKSLPRALPFLIVAAIVFGGIFLIYNYFSARNNASVKVLTISKDGKFSSGNFKIGNRDKFKIKNNDNVNQTVKIESTNQTLVEIDSESTSKELDLKDNSSSTLFLASNLNQKSVVTVGEPQATSKTTVPQAVNKATTGAVQAADTKNEPLPNTGAGDSYLLSLTAIVGFFLLKFSNLFWKKFVS